YGQVVDALTGGTKLQSGTLAVDALTQASDQAVAKIREQVGVDQPGHLRWLSPQSVATSPSANTPASVYTVTVTMKLIEVVYAAKDLNKRITQELPSPLAANQRFIKPDPPIISVNDQPTTTSPPLEVKAQGESSLTATSTFLKPSLFIGLDREHISARLGS